MEQEHLKKHLPFIIEMIESVKTVEFRQKWQNMKDLIESNMLSDKHVETIELNIQKAKQLKEQFKKTIVAVSPPLDSEIKSNAESIEVLNDSAKGTNKQEKELKRLFENIVKDDIPLPSKRRSAQKRSYRDSLEFLFDVSPSKSQEKKEKLEPKKPTVSNKRKSEADAVCKVLKSDFLSPQNGNKKYGVYEIFKPVLKPSKVYNNPKVLTKLIISPKKFKTAEAKIKTPETIKSPKIEAAAKTVEVKKEKLDKLKRKIQKQQKKDLIKKKQIRSNLMTKGATIGNKGKKTDDEWEDLDETLESDEEGAKNIIKKKIERKSPKNYDETLIKTVLSAAPQDDEKPAEIKLIVKRKEEIPGKAQLEQEITIKAERKEATIVKLQPKVEPVIKSQAKIEPNPVVVKKVHNISYSRVKNGFLLKCLVLDCKFETIENTEFADHIENEHLTIKWEGHCDICKDKVDKTRSIIFELMHMREDHLLKEPIEAEHSDEAKKEEKSEVKKEENSEAEKLPTLDSANHQEIEKKKPKPIENVKIVGKKIDIGKVNLKVYKPAVETKVDKKIEEKLKEGTKLLTKADPQPSTSKLPTLNENPASDEILKHIIIKPKSQTQEAAATKAKSPETKTETEPQKTNNSQEVAVGRQKTVENLKDINVSVDLLRPWLKRKIKKYLMPTTRFLDNVSAIVAIYKCMSSKCSFYTSERKLFTIHSRLHETQASGERDYMNCAYCDHVFGENEGIKALIDHIDFEHCYDKYQCVYCFYRSCVSLNVINHQKTYHPMKQKCVYEIQREKIRNYEQEMSKIKKYRVKYVPPLICVKCSAKFYLFPKLATHMKTHGSYLKTKCNKCGVVTDLCNIHKHFINCHKLGLYQCVYCNFGTNNFDTIINHIGNSHPSKLPIYCERSSENFEEKNQSSIDTTSLKFLTQQVDHKIVVKPEVGHESLRNERCVFDIGNTVRAQQQGKPIAKQSRTSTPNLSKNSSQNLARNPATINGAPKTPAVPINTSKLGKQIVIKKIPSSQSTDDKGMEKKEATTSGISNEKSSGLQIKSVYSLNSN